MKVVLLIAALLLTGPRSFAGMEITVSAASSLSNAFTAVGKAFRRVAPGLSVRFNFGASGALLQQIQNGAPVAVFASADKETMDRAEARGLIDRASRRNFATNRLVLARPSGDHSAVTTLRDLLGLPVKRIALGNPVFVPAGRYGQQVLESAGLWNTLEPKLILGSTARQVLGYLARAEADAGFVFATDVAAAQGKVVIVEDLKAQAPVVYPIAVVVGQPGEAAARRFVEFVSGPEGREILREHGFLESLPGKGVSPRQTSRLGRRMPTVAVPRQDRKEIVP